MGLKFLCAKILALKTKLLDAIIKLTTLHIGDLIMTHRGGEMSGGLDVEQLLVDDLEVLSTPLAGARHRVIN